MSKRITDLSNAKVNKKDEFYTQLEDIEKEMSYYKDYFNDKVVFLNCDDPTSSAFWEYFHLKFSELNLKRLVSTHYDRNAPTYKLVYEGGDDLNIEAGEKTPLRQNGDFRSDESVQLLKESDVVVTNPPFSLFREYIGQLVEYNKDFIVLGNMNAVSYKEIFPLIRDNKLWYGNSIHSGDRWFRVPDDYPLEASSSRIDDDGNKFVKVKGVRWFTNIDTPQRHEELILWKNYSPEEFPQYDNYDAIEVSNANEIPVDYFDEMGVPISFLDKYCPTQFELIGNFNNSAINKKVENGYVPSTNVEIMIKGKLSKWNGPVVNSKPKYKRLVIKRIQEDEV